jgi:hypothetical protein
VRSGRKGREEEEERGKGCCCVWKNCCKVVEVADEGEEEDGAGSGS